MELVIDSNCLISALIKSGKSRELICSSKLILYSPEHILYETSKHKEDIISKSGITKEDFDILFAVLTLRIKTIPESEFIKFKEKAKNLVTHPEDEPFMALALQKDIPIWSDDKDLKYQSIVKVYSTSELIKII